jgi:TonB family protein
MPLGQQNRTPETRLSIGDSAQTPRRQLLIALTLLLAALVLILAKDREFWFPSTPALQSESEPIEEALPQQTPQSTATNAARPALPGRLKVKPGTPPSAATELKPGEASGTVVTSRAVLPPLEVEVVAGDQHHPIQESNNSVKVDLQSPAPVASAQPFSAPEPSNSAGVSDLSGRVLLSPKTAEVVSRSVEPSYPLLAKQMKVQGAVVLEALIGREGNIQRLQVLSGPAILSAAARAAVEQWRFRPYLLSGQPVETQSRITVNFTIWTR